MEYKVYIIREDDESDKSDDIRFKNWGIKPIEVEEFSHQDATTQAVEKLNDDLWEEMFPHDGNIDWFYKAKTIDENGVIKRYLCSAEHTLKYKATEIKDEKKG